MRDKLTQSELELLSAWLDRELDDEQHQYVTQQVAENDDWAKALNQLKQTDELLSNWLVPAPADRDALVGSILRQTRAVHWRNRTIRLVKWLTPVAAAAAVVIAVLVWQPGSTPQTPTPPIATVPDSFVQDNLEVFTATEPTDENLAEEIERLTGGSLRNAMQKPAKSWASLSEERRQQARQEALAFLHMTPQQQDEVLEKYEQQADTTTKPAVQWLRAVVDSFTPQQRDELLHMSPDQRAKAFLQRRNELMQQGKLKQQ